MEKKCRNSRLSAMALGLWCALALGARIAVASVAQAEEDLSVGMYDGTHVSIDGAPKLLVFFAKLRQNLPQDAWAWSVCAVGLAVLFYRLHTGGNKEKPGRVVAAFSVLFGLVQVLSLSICKLDSWAFLAENSYQLLVSLFCAGGYAILFYHAVWGLFLLLNRLAGLRPATAKGRFASLWDAHPAALSSVVLVGAWLPWLLACLPGSVDWDSHTQISQILGDLPLTAHHTVLSTWLHGGAVALGRLLGSDNLGVFFYIAFQTLVAAWVFGQVVRFAARLRLPRCVQGGVLAFFALVPAWGAFVQTMVKDTLFAVVFTLFVLRMAELMLTDTQTENAAQNNKALARCLAAAVCTCLLRQNGIYAVLPALAAACLMQRRGKLRRTALCGAAAAVAFVLLFGTVTRLALAIPDGSKSEMLSIPFQQTARYVKYYSEEVTPEEKAAINVVLAYDTLGQNYDPMMSDKVKATYKNPTPAEMSAYFGTWLSMLRKKPVIYLQALQANTYGYYSITDSNFAYEYYMFINTGSMAWQGLDIHYLDTSGYARYALYNYLLAFEHSPLGLFTSRGFNSLLLLALGFWLARRRLRGAIPLLMAVGVLWLTCIASPVNDLLRYFLPLLGALPVIFCTAIYAARPENTRYC